MTQQDQLKRITEIKKLLDDGLSKDEFIKAFELVVKQVVSIEKKMLEKADETMQEMKTGCEMMKEHNDEDCEKMRKESMSKIENLIKECENLNNFVHDKVSKLQNGKDGADGADGLDGKNGKDGSPDTPAQVRDKLEGLKDGEKLSIQAIQDLAEKLEELEKKALAKGTSGQAYGSIRTRYIDDETPTGTVNGTNKIFTVSKSPVVGSLKVYRGGARQRVTEDYTLSDKTITFTLAPQVGEILLVDFRY